MTWWLWVLVGFGLLAFVGLYTVGSWLKFRPLKIGKFELIYPRLPVDARPPSCTVVNRPGRSTTSVLMRPLLTSARAAPVARDRRASAAPVATTSRRTGLHRSGR